MHCLQRKKPDLSAKSHSGKYQEKIAKNDNFSKIIIFWGIFLIFLGNWTLQRAGVLCCYQCIKTLYLSYQTSPYDDFHFLAYNWFLQFLRPLVAGVKRKDLS